MHDCRAGRGVGTSIYIREHITFVKRDLDIQIEDCNMTSIISTKAESNNIWNI